MESGEWRYGREETGNSLFPVTSVESGVGKEQAPSDIRDTRDTLDTFIPFIFLFSEKKHDSFFSFFWENNRKDASNVSLASREKTRTAVTRHSTLNTQHSTLFSCSTTASPHSEVLALPP